MAMSDEIDLWFEWNGLRLAGSLHLPPGAGPHPAVLMAQGSGAADRDSGGYFSPIRQSLIDQGIATFAFDKPGCGQSTGDWRDYALEARADQCVSALAHMREHPAVANEHVGIWGHSQGGWLVQKLAGRGVDLAFAVASSAPTISVQEQIVYDCEQSMRGHGHNDEHVDAAVALTHALIEAAVDGADFMSISEQLIDPARKQSWFGDYPASEGPLDWRHFTLLVSERHDPLSDLTGISCPFLAIYGGGDPLLPPWQGAEESGRALATAETLDATVVVFPSGDHRMQDPGSKDLVDGYLALLSSWVAKRVH